MTREKRHRIIVELHVLGVARHDHLHEVFRDAVARLAFDQHFVDLAIIEVTNRPLDQIAFLIDRGRCDRFQRQLAHLLPLALQIFIVALDLGLGAFGTRRAHDQTSALRHIDLTCDLFELLAIRRIGDLARNPAAARSVWHEHAVATRERQISGQRRTFIAALFLDDLNQQDLANLDDLLDLVALGARFAGLADFFRHILLRDRFDILVFVGGFQFLRRIVVDLFIGGRCLNWCLGDCLHRRLRLIRCIRIQINDIHTRCGLSLIRGDSIVSLNLFGLGF